MKILICDDEVEIVTMLEDIILDHFPSMEVTKAYNGLEALELCKKEKFDAITSDQKMPKMTGLEFFHALNNIPNLNKETPIAFITAFAQDLKKELGSDEFFIIPKPFSNDELIKVVKLMSVVSKFKKTS
jgi:two-component system response regulator ResD